MTLSVQLYSVRDALIADPVATLERLALIGFDEFEPFGLGETSTPLEQRIAAARTLAASAAVGGVAISTTHASIPRDVDELVAEVNALGARRVVVPNPKKVPGFDPAIFASAERIRSFAERMNDLADRLASNGVALGYHNHEFEWDASSGRPGIDLLWELLDPRIGAEVDIYWASVAGIDVPAYLTALGERVFALHVKDGPAHRGAGQTPLGTGEVDLAGALDAAPEAVRVLEIDVTERDRLDLLSVNADWLRCH